MVLYHSFLFLVLIGTWRTHIAKEESAWCKVGQNIPVEYAATVSVNPCTALLEDFADLQAGQRHIHVLRIFLLMKLEMQCKIIFIVLGSSNDLD